MMREVGACARSLPKASGEADMLSGRCRPLRRVRWRRDFKAA